MTKSFTVYKFIKETNKSFILLFFNFINLKHKNLIINIDKI